MSGALQALRAVPRQAPGAVTLLQTMGVPVYATSLAERLGCAVEAVYAELVSAESRGLVRVVPMTTKADGSSRCGWEAM